MVDHGGSKVRLHLSDYTLTNSHPLFFLQELQSIAYILEFVHTHLPLFSRLMQGRKGRVRRGRKREGEGEGEGRKGRERKREKVRGGKGKRKGRERER